MRWVASQRRQHSCALAGSSIGTAPGLPGSGQAHLAGSSPWDGKSKTLPEVRSHPQNLSGRVRASLVPCTVQGSPGGDPRYVQTLYPNPLVRCAPRTGVRSSLRRSHRPLRGCCQRLRRACSHATRGDKEVTRSLGRRRARRTSTSEGRRPTNLFALRGECRAGARAIRSWNCPSRLQHHQRDGSRRIHRHRA